MWDIVGKKIWYFAFSGLIIIPGIVALAIWGLNLGIDFTGGSLLELKFEKQIEKDKLSTSLKEKGIDVSSTTPTAADTYLVRTKPLSEEEHKKALETLKNKFGSVSEI